MAVAGVTKVVAGATMSVAGATTAVAGVAASVAGVATMEAGVATVFSWCGTAGVAVLVARFGTVVTDLAACVRSWRHQACRRLELARHRALLE